MKNTHSGVKLPNEWVRYNPSTGQVFNLFPVKTSGDLERYPFE